MWEIGKLSSISAIGQIMSSNRYCAIKSVFAFQGADVEGAWQQLTKLGELLHLFRTACEGAFQPDPGSEVKMSENSERAQGQSRGSVLSCLNILVLPSHSQTMTAS